MKTITKLMEPKECSIVYASVQFWTIVRKSIGFVGMHAIANVTYLTLIYCEYSLGSPTLRMGVS